MGRGGFPFHNAVHRISGVSSRKCDCLIHYPIQSVLWKPAFEIYAFESGRSCIWFPLIYVCIPRVQIAFLWISHNNIHVEGMDNFSVMQLFTHGGSILCNRFSVFFFSAISCAVLSSTRSSSRIWYLSIIVSILSTMLRPFLVSTTTLN